MEETTTNQRNTRQTTVYTGNPVRGHIHGGAGLRNCAGQTGSLGFLICLLTMSVVFALMLPVMAFMYMDTLALKKEVNSAVKKVYREENRCRKDDQ